MMSWRGVTVVLLHTALIVNTMPRTNLPVVLVCMVNRQRSHPYLNSSENLTLTTKSETTTYEFNWDSEILGLLLSGVQFFAFLGPLVATLTSHLLNVKLCLTLFSVVNIVLSTLSPIAARTSPYMLLVISITSGITSTTIAPVLGESLAWWSPDSEKLTWMSVANAGIQIGSSVSHFMSGYLFTVPLDNGWPFTFYLTGVLNLIWLTAWQFLYVDKPEDHPYISEEERNYIIANRVGMTSATKKIKAPLKQILKSVPVIAFFYAWTCHMWALIVILIYVPQYLSGLLKFSAPDTGVIVSNLSMALFLGAFLWTGLGNWLRTCTPISTSNIRKLCVFTGMTAVGLLNVLLCFLDEEYKFVDVAVICAMMALASVGMSTLAVIPLDMSPMFAGLIMSLSFSFGMLVSISGPLVVASMTYNNTFEEWRKVWILTTPRPG